MAVDTWYAVAPADDGEEKAIAFRVAEDLRWTKIGIIVSSQFFKAQLNKLWRCNSKEYHNE